VKIFIAATGVGNIHSLATALRRLGGEPEVTLSLRALREADAIVLPGVGSFSSALRRLEPLRPHLLEAVESGAPTLGICLGYQLFFRESEEGPGRGLELFKGRVVRLPKHVKAPHIGWNTLERVKQTPLTEGVEEGCFVYFLHSYYPVLEEQIAIAETTYGVTFPSIAGKPPAYGVQFHPERSGQVGLRILSNFLGEARR